jgi:hypothetical protein
MSRQENDDGYGKKSYGKGKAYRKDNGGHKTFLIESDKIAN